MSSEPIRETYRHGDLRRAMIDAGVALARVGGPASIGLREVTRQAGVVPNAAYRHFASLDELRFAVRGEALAAFGRAIVTELGKVPSGTDRVGRAKARLHAVGRAYIAFALAEPGLFRTAFFAQKPVAASGTEPIPTPAANPFTLLGSVLDEMVAAGLLPAERRPGAEYLAWSAVHGFATLAVDGPLAALGAEMRTIVGDRLVAMVERGL